MENLLNAIHSLGYRTDIEENSKKEFSIYSKDNDDDLLVNVYENSYTIQDNNVDDILINTLDKFKGDVDNV